MFIVSRYFFSHFGFSILALLFIYIHLSIVFHVILTQIHMRFDKSCFSFNPSTMLSNPIMLSHLILTHMSWLKPQKSYCGFDFEW